MLAALLPGTSEVLLQPVATVLGAVVVATAAVLTLRQRRRADADELRKEREMLEHQRERDRRQHWWLRAQWAIDLSLSPEAPRRELGTRAMELLADEVADPDDLALLLVAVERAVDTPSSGGHDERSPPRPGSAEGPG